MRLGCAVIAADMPETDRLWDTVTAWWEQIETYIDTRVTNARTEAANTTIKQIPVLDWSIRRLATAAA